VAAPNQLRGAIKVSGGLAKTADPKRIAEELERVTREISNRMLLIEKSQLNTGTQLHESYAAEQGVRANMLVYVDQGRCWLTNARYHNRYCTDVVIEVVGNRVYSAPLGNDFNCFRTVPEGTSNKLFASIYPGYATAVPESETGAVIYQQIGEQRSKRGTNGLCKLALNPQQITLLSAP
jgi:hypothetical protein